MVKVVRSFFSCMLLSLDCIETARVGLKLHGPDTSVTWL